jgi:excinuclease UvrABC nuclease subunit
MSKAKLQKSRYLRPYNKEGKTNLIGLKNKSGVYLIKNYDTDELKYIGFSASNLYKTILRHFQAWPDRTQIRVTFNKTDYVVRVVLCSPAKAEKLEKALIERYSPTDNPRAYKSMPRKSYNAIIDKYDWEPAKKIDEIAPF